MININLNLVRNTEGFGKGENKEDLEENYCCKTIKDSSEDINAGERQKSQEKR
jgi:hypothetical protein